MTLALCEPSVALVPAFLEALPGYHADGIYLEFDAERIAADPAGLVALLERQADPANQPPGRMPNQFLWLIEDGEFIGRLSFRMPLNDVLRRVGGNIGYDIRPSKRRQGYGTRLLALGLEYARGRGLDRVLITCNADNIGSRRVIEANGGVFEDEVDRGPEHGIVCRYWIELSR